jgi:hypothetical protein
MGGGDTMSVGENNLKHVLEGNCTDRDCELHRPAVIEDEEYRLTACAWFLAGAQAAIAQALEDFDASVFGDSDDRWSFLGDDGDIDRDVETDLLEDR